MKNTTELPYLFTTTSFNFVYIVENEAECLRDSPTGDPSNASQNTSVEETFEKEGSVFYSMSVTFYYILIAVAIVVFFFVAVVGNISVIIVIYKDHHLSKHKQNLYLLSMSVADALIMIFVVPFSLTDTLTGEWPFGQVYCNIYRALDVLLCTASIWNILIIGLDRYVSVKYPITFRKFRTDSRINCGIASVSDFTYLI